MKKINFLASLCSLAGWFEIHFVGNPEHRFCRVEAQVWIPADIMHIFKHNFILYYKIVCDNVHNISRNTA